MVILLSVGSQVELEEIVAIQTPALFRESKIILILPGHDQTMIFTGLRLQPRFMTYVDSDFSEISRVLAKILGLDNPCSHGLHDQEEMLG
jgi:hypothetical protein